MADDLDGEQGGEGRRPSLWRQISEGYDQLVDAVIRPPRSIYELNELGATELSWMGKRFVREDVSLDNGRGLRLQCSWWKLSAVDKPAGPQPVCIYLHGNAGCRLAAASSLHLLLSSAISVFALDFAGSGLSEGEYVSLGHFEQEDVACVIEHLRASGEVSTIALWGHSMGAVTALLYGDKDPSIAAMILDSPFADLTQLAYELVQMSREQGFWIPGFAVSVAMGSIRRAVRKRAGFDMRQVKPVANCDKCFIPALFAHGMHDDFIKPHHSKELHEAYAGDKKIILFNGDHNSERPQDFLDSAIVFLKQTMQVDGDDFLAPTRLGSQSPMGQMQWMGQQGQTIMRRAEMEMMRRAMQLSLMEQDGRAPQADQAQLTDADAPSTASEYTSEHSTILIDSNSEPHPDSVSTPEPNSDSDNTYRPQYLDTQSTTYSVAAGTTEVSISELPSVITKFEEVVGVGGDTAAQFCQDALLRGFTQDAAISEAIARYFEAVSNGTSLEAGAGAADIDQF